jgi:hypothetical protein
LWKQSHSVLSREYRSPDEASQGAVLSSPPIADLGGSLATVVKRTTGTIAATSRYKQVMALIFALGRVR